MTLTNSLYRFIIGYIQFYFRPEKESSNNIFGGSVSGPTTAAAAAAGKKLAVGGKSKNRLCENCGKTIHAPLMARHRSECRKLNQFRLQQQQQQREEEREETEEELEDGTTKTVVVVRGARSKRYVPVHLSGICPFCELKFSDLLGHIRHGHAKEKDALEKGEVNKEGDVTTTTTMKPTCPLCSETFGSIR